MATEPPAPNPHDTAGAIGQTSWTSSAVQRLTGAIITAAAEEARSAAVSATTGGLFWWLSHR